MQCSNGCTMKLGSFLHGLGCSDVPDSRCSDVTKRGLLHLQDFDVFQPLSCAGVSHGGHHVARQIVQRVLVNDVLSLRESWLEVRHKHFPLLVLRCLLTKCFSPSDSSVRVQFLRNQAEMWEALTDDSRGSVLASCNGFPCQQEPKLIFVPNDSAKFSFLQAIGVKLRDDRFIFGLVECFPLF